MDKVALGKYSFDSEEWSYISEDAKKFIKRLLEYDVDARITAGVALQDPWIKKQLGSQEIDKPLAVSALTNLRNFRVICPSENVEINIFSLKADRKLQEATWVFLVNYLATKEEKNELLKTFQALDLNGDGQLTREELIQGMILNAFCGAITKIGYKKILGSSTPEEDVDAIMKVIDQNSNGAIDYSGND
mgnify:CR=1 FL=1